MKTTTFAASAVNRLLLFVVVSSCAGGVSAQSIEGTWQTSAGPMTFTRSADGTIVGLHASRFAIRGNLQGARFRGESYAGGATNANDQQAVGEVSLEFRRYRDHEVWQGTHLTLSTDSSEEQSDQFVLWRRRNASNGNSGGIGGTGSRMGTGILGGGASGYQGIGIQQQQQQQQTPRRNWGKKWGKSKQGHSTPGNSGFWYSPSGGGYYPLQPGGSDPNTPDGDGGGNPTDDESGNNTERDD